MQSKIKMKSLFVCSQCGAESLRWSGKCPQCNEWNCMNEEIVESSNSFSASSGLASIGSATAQSVTQIPSDEEIRYVTGISELDRVLGGGLVKGSIVLLSGDPGIGKSTLLMQICNRLCNKNSILYVSGEESSRQLKLRAQRLGVSSDNLLVMTETDVQRVCEYIRQTKPSVVMVDSIQTMNFMDLNSSPGSVTQVRECTNALLKVGKNLDIPIIIVGHVNKDGAIAGPKVMEHIVDAVLYFEGERNHSYRILRAIKNRFGSTNEIGVFEMCENGLSEVQNPSLMLLSGRVDNVSGSCIVCEIEGSRPIFAEIQGLVTTTGFGNPRRMSTGFDYNRLNLLLAVLEKRLGYYFSNLDVYLNIVGGLHLDEPATDLAVALALVSGLKDKPIPPDIVAFGEVGLSGEIRTVPRATLRVVEAARLGFKRCIMPKGCVKQFAKTDISSEIEIIAVSSLKEAVQVLFN